MSQEIVSFVLRFVREANEEQQARWRGLIRHVQGGSESSFTQFAEAVAFMQDEVNETVRTAFAETNSVTESNPITETAKLWGAFMPQYTKLMTEAMNATLNSTLSATEQMERMMAATLSTWGLKPPDEEADLARALAQLTEQIAKIDGRLNALERELSELKRSASNA